MHTEGREDGESGREFQKAEELSITDEGLRDNYRHLRKVMDENNNHLDGNNFYRQEMTVQRGLKNLKREDRAIFHLAYWSSDFWGSWAQVVLWIGALWVWFVFVETILQGGWEFWWILGYDLLCLNPTSLPSITAEGIWDGLGLSVTSFLDVTNPLSIVKADFWEKYHEPWWVYLAVFVFKVATTLLYYQLAVCLKRLMKR